ncbi:hypothetical protein [Spiroplasma endosymbiont of Virgichneumon dumeticola]|uniref:hypothetical protein n=1 Tax=Spiroplasma endosymbiont of Virgichneumon dumeticola TaxID=3139323 RepID=UPI0035C8A478
MIQEQSTTSTIGYDHYFLTNKTNDDDSFNQHDWIDLDSKSEMYIYLPDVNNIKDAISLLTLTDSAKTINLPNPISWKQVNNTTYTNNNFITEDTSVGTSSLMDSEKFNQILASNKSKTWTNKEMNKAFLPLCTIFKFYHINAEKSHFNFINMSTIFIKSNLI